MDKDLKHGEKSFARVREDMKELRKELGGMKDEIMETLTAVRIDIAGMKGKAAAWGSAGALVLLIVFECGRWLWRVKGGE